MAGRRLTSRRGLVTGRNGKVIHVAPHQSNFGFSLRSAICGAVADAANSVVLSLRLTTCAKCRQMAMDHRRAALAAPLVRRKLVPKPMFIDGRWYAMAEEKT